MPAKKKTSAEKRSAERRAQERWEKEMDRLDKMHEAKDRVKQLRERLVIIFSNHNLQALYDEIVQEVTDVLVLKDLEEDERIHEFAKKVADDIFKKFPDAKPSSFGSIGFREFLVNLQFEIEVNLPHIQFEQRNKPVTEAMADAIVLNYSHIIKAQTNQKRKLARNKKKMAEKKTGGSTATHFIPSNHSLPVYSAHRPYNLMWPFIVKLAH
jgi:hypothetical protein